MAKKILLCVDESENSQKAVNFVAEFLPRDARVTVFSVIPEPAAACGMDSPSLVPVFKESQQAFCSIENLKRDALNAFAKKARNTLVDSGFDAGNVQVDIRKRQQGIARDILATARDGAYDVVVVGRRGQSAIREFFSGSVSTKIAQAATDRTVVVVD